MSPTLMVRALRKSVGQVQHVSVVPPKHAHGLVAAVYGQVERDFGMLAPPVALHSAAAGPLAACWVILRETLLVPGHVGRAAKEAVAAAVSVGNACPYCAAVHNAALGGFSYQLEAKAIADDHFDSIANPELRELADWARATGRRDTAGRAQLFPGDQFAELAGVAITFQYFNRMVTLFLEDSPLPSKVPARVAVRLMRVLGRLVESAARSGAEPGASLALLPEAPIPADLSWAAGSARITDAFARAIAAIEAAGKSAVSDPVRELVACELETWDGQPRGLSRSWVEDAVARLAGADRQAGRLALLTAFAPHQVGAPDIAAFRREQPADSELIELTAWASMAAARHIGSWLALRPGPSRTPPRGGDQRTVPAGEGITSP